LLLYFYLLGGTAERFFCPALCRLSAGLKMSPNVAGVTLLAIGNGSPDIFSTIASVQQNLFGQALGSLLGGGMFVTSVVVGSVTLASKGVVPKVTRRPFIRDVGFYLVALVSIFFICWDGRVHLWESVFFIGFYVLYVVVIIVGRLIYQRRKKARILKMSMATSVAEADKDEFEFVGTGTGGKSYDDYDEETDENGVPLIGNHGRNTAGLLHADSTFESGEDGSLHARITTPAGAGPNLRQRMAKRMAALGVYISKVGFWRNKTKGELKREVRMTLARSKHGDHHHTSRRTHGIGMRQTVQRISDLADPDELTAGEYMTTDSDGLAQESDAEQQVTFGGWGIGSIVNHQLLSINNDLPEADVDDALIDHTTKFGEDHVPLLADSEEFEEPDYSWEDNIDASTCEGAIRLNWRNLKDILEWDEAKSIKDYIIMFADFPRLFFQHFTIHFAEPDTYFRPFYVLQPLGIALFLLSAFGGWTLKTGLPGPLAAWIVPLSLILCVIVYFTTKNEEPPVYEWLFIIVGLFMSIFWIYFTAQELVALLSAAGKILRINNAIMGLTVLAWGNSIGDMVSNVVVSRKGFPQMAIAACYASPLCTMLLGLGISLTIRIVKLRAVSFSLEHQLPNTVFWGFLFLIGGLIFTLVIVPLSKFSFSKMTGYILLGLYAVFTLISILTEFRLIFPNVTIWTKWPGRSRS
jgi:Ca2+/Na+ antiporter